MQSFKRTYELEVLKLVGFCTCCGPGNLVVDVSSLLHQIVIIAELDKYLFSQFFL